MKKIAAGGKKGLRYVSAFGLLLSLPVFSYLIPDSSRLGLHPPSESVPRTPESPALKREGNLALRSSLPPPVTQSKLKIEEPDPSEKLEVARLPLDLGEVVAPFGFEDRPLPLAKPRARRGQAETAPLVEWVPGWNSVKVASEHDGKNYQGHVPGELALLDYGYEIALNHLFNGAPRQPDLSPSNPFREAIRQTIARETPRVTQDAPASRPEPVAAENIAQASLLRPSEGYGDKFEQRAFDFLLIGEVSANSRRRTFRAVRERDGSFVLDDYTRFLLPSRGFIPFWDDEKVLTTDLNRDGLADLIVLRQGSSDTAVDVYVGKGGTQFKSMTSVLVPQRVVGAGVLDVSGDREEDLVVLVEGVPHLFVYERSGEQLRYAREMVVPFVPALLVESQDETGEQRRLHVFNSSLTEVLTLTAESRGVFLGGPGSLLEQFKMVKLDSLARSRSAVEFLILEYSRRITVVEKTAEGVLFYGSFSAANRMPLIIVGDYFFPGKRQLLFGP